MGAPPPPPTPTPTPPLFVHSYNASMRRKERRIANIGILEGNAADGGAFYNQHTSS